MTKREERAIEMGMKVEKLEKWEELFVETEKETRGQKRILDPFKGWIKK